MWCEMMASTPTCCCTLVFRESWLSGPNIANKRPLFLIASIIVGLLVYWLEHTLLTIGAASQIRPSKLLDLANLIASFMELQRISVSASGCLQGPSWTR